MHVSNFMHVRSSTELQRTIHMLKVNVCLSLCRIQALGLVYMES